MVDVALAGIFGSVSNPTSGVTQGRIITGVMRGGRYNSNVPVSGIPFKEQDIPSASGTYENKLSNRFDDIGYYTA